MFLRGARFEYLWDSGHSFYEETNRVITTADLLTSRYKDTALSSQKDGHITLAANGKEHVENCRETENHKAPRLDGIPHSTTKLSILASTSLSPSEVFSKNNSHRAVKK